MSERVDKQWQQKGIDTYSTAAILGTLRHYGVDLDEAGFRALAAEDFPLTIAWKWRDQWKGTGQFLRFPASAAEELWSRLCEGRLAPSTLALALINLMEQLSHTLDGRPDDGTRESRFAVVEALLPKVPTERAAHERFVGELVGALQDWAQPFELLAVTLAERGHPALADRFVAIDETLFPVRRGTASALVKAAKGDREGAVADLVRLAEDATRGLVDRGEAVDGLLHLDGYPEAKRVALALLDQAEKEKDLELIAELVGYLRTVLEHEPDKAERDALRRRLVALLDSLEILKRSS